MQRIAVWSEAEFLAAAKDILDLPSNRVFFINEIVEAKSLHFSVVCAADKLLGEMRLYPLLNATYVFVPDDTPVDAWVNQNWVYADAWQRADFLSLNPKTAPPRGTPPMEKTEAVWAIANFWTKKIEASVGCAVEWLAEDLHQEIMKESVVWFGGHYGCASQTDPILQRLGFFDGAKELPPNATTWIDWRTGRPKVKVDGQESFLNPDGVMGEYDYLKESK